MREQICVVMVEPDGLVHAVEVDERTDQLVHPMCRALMHRDVSVRKVLEPVTCFECVSKGFE